MPNIKLDDMLIVAAEIKLVSTDDQPSRQELIDGLQDPDARILRELTRRSDQSPTLKDFLLLRAKEPPTQSLDIIIGLLSNKKPFEIDRDNLLVNLLHAQQQGLIEPDDIGTLMRHYVTLVSIAAKDPSLDSVQFIDCLTGDKPGVAAALSSVITTALHGSPMLSLSKQANIEWVTINTPKYPILQQAIAVTFDTANDPIQLRLGGNTLEKKSSDANTVYTAPLPILSDIYAKTCGTQDHPVASLPVFGCYSFAHLRQLSCSADGGTEYRPVTLPTYLPQGIRRLFYGARANDLSEVVYDLYSADPDPRKHFLDMQRAHGNRVGIVGFLSASFQRKDDNFMIFKKVLELNATPEFKRLLLSTILSWTKAKDLEPLKKHFGAKGAYIEEFVFSKKDSLKTL